MTAPNEKIAVELRLGSRILSDAEQAAARLAIPLDRFVEEALDSALASHRCRHGHGALRGGAGQLQARGHVGAVPADDVDLGADDEDA